ncbi:immunoglobulin domain-containing protein [Alosa sapidissima]|uniref:immunoglobulin domain-containing protein n=1 Tax=Alosa sapidissima TaxID=34773 RepID=UPI001C08AD54|nr:immunoglobulin domain-containing protein [Alosa sapidissima]
MAYRLTPRHSFFCALMCLVFPHTGISNKGIFIALTKEETAMVLSCVLSGNMKVVQTSWEKGISPNRTNVGTFHPEHGSHIPDQYKDQVELLDDKSTPNKTTLRLKNGVMNETNIFCCVFNTFPSGTLDSCIDISKNNDTQALTQEKSTGDDQRLVRHWALLVGGSFLALLILSMFIFFCWRKNRRANSFQIQSAEPRSESEAHSESFAQPNPSQGFDPSKLYAKIKQDLYYGRLWKSYQGRPQT